jgi:hypothetical protein
LGAFSHSCRTRPALDSNPPTTLTA